MTSLDGSSSSPSKKGAGAQIGCVILFILVAISPLLFWSHNQAQIIESRIPLANGDTIFQYLTPGPTGLFEPGSPTIELFIQWRETGKKELFYTGPANFYTGGQFGSWHDTKTEIYVVQTSGQFFWKPKGNSEPWRKWSFMLPKRQPLYEYLRKYAALYPRSKFHEVKNEFGIRLTNTGERSTGDDSSLGDEREQTWCLPYVICQPDFQNNILTAKLRRPVNGLPEYLVFSGPSSSFGGWEFDPVKTAQTNQ